MKIFFVINSLSNSGGTERVISMLANDWCKTDIITIITMKSDSTFFDIDSRVKIIDLGGSAINNWLKIRKTLKKEQPDVIISASLKLLNIFMGSIYLLSNCKSMLKIAAEHISYQSAGYKINFLKRIFYRKFDYISVLTDHDKKLMDRHFDNVVVIRNPSPFEINVETLSKKEGNCIVAVGRLTYQKGFDRLLTIWSMVDKEIRKNWSLTIVGNGEDEKKLKDQASALQIDSQVTFLPPTKDISSLYKKSDIYLMTSRFEGLPMVLIEAKSFGLPCIAFDCKTGPSEIIYDGHDGYVIPDGDYQLFVERLENIMQTPSLIEKMSLASLNYSKEYSISSIRNEWYNIFTRCKPHD